MDEKGKCFICGEEFPFNDGKVVIQHGQPYFVCGDYCETVLLSPDYEELDDQ